MNKANVFLLVVVSSLITYISTATQPAATAGTAQEKWEYFMGYTDFWRDLNADESVVIRSKKRNFFPVGKLEMLDRHLGEWEKVVSFEPTNGQEVPFDTEGKGYAYYLKLERWAYEASGEAGWHVFQVDQMNRTEDANRIEWNESKHWRRRVQ
jgi:hypothetical protein